MVRPRFTKFPAQQQQAIVQAALDEFAAHGFHDASLNRVIDAAGISKGSMYYYFDGKEDLYAYVAHSGWRGCSSGSAPSRSGRRGCRCLLVGSGRLLPPADAALVASPQLAALLRGWVAAAKSPALAEAQEELEQSSLPWIAQVLATGQRVGAVRRRHPAQPADRGRDGHGRGDGRLAHVPAGRR